MKYYTISNEINSIDNNALKNYNYSYAASGFELGFGKRGVYSGHSHLFFYDIIFSRTPIISTDAKGNIITGKLIIIPPRTYIGNVTIGDFFFLKFCPTNDTVITPDKVNSILCEGLIMSANHLSELTIPFYRNSSSTQSFTSLKLANDRLEICINNNYILVIP